MLRRLLALFGLLLSLSTPTISLLMLKFQKRVSMQQYHFRLLIITIYNRLSEPASLLIEAGDLHLSIALLSTNPESS